MKKQLISCLYGGLVFVLSVNFSFVQDETIRELPAITITASTSNVSAKVNKAFGQYFKEASHQRWYQLEKNFLVKFIQHDQENSALFTKNGQCIYHICYGTERNPPSDVRGLVKSTYYDQSITRVLKVNQDQRNIWVVSLEDDKEYVMVRVEAMEMEETQRQQKSK